MRKIFIVIFLLAANSCFFVGDSVEQKLEKLLPKTNNIDWQLRISETDKTCSLKVILNYTTVKENKTDVSSFFKTHLSDYKISIEYYYFLFCFQIEGKSNQELTGQIKNTINRTLKDEQITEYLNRLTKDQKTIYYFSVKNYISENIFRNLISEIKNLFSNSNVEFKECNLNLKEYFQTVLDYESLLMK